MYKVVWEKRYQNDSSSAGRKTSLFSSEVRGYFPTQGKLLELGAGFGQDSRFFAGCGYDVFSTDVADSALRSSAAVTPQTLLSKITFVNLDLCAGFPFPDACFDVVYAHLSLHYFSGATTITIIAEVKRVLKAGGVFAFLVNSTGDPRYGTGTKIENDFFQVEEDIGTVSKRYFSIETTKQLTAGFQTILLDDSGEDRRKSMGGIHHLIRFVGRNLP